VLLCPTKCPSVKLYAHLIKENIVGTIYEGSGANIKTFITTSPTLSDTCRTAMAFQNLI
jgi:hypothetical protein